MGTPVGGGIVRFIGIPVVGGMVRFMGMPDGGEIPLLLGVPVVVPLFMGVVGAVPLFMGVVGAVPLFMGVVGVVPLFIGVAGVVPLFGGVPLSIGILAGGGVVLRGIVALLGVLNSLFIWVFTFLSHSDWDVGVDLCILCAPELFIINICNLNSIVKSEDLYSKNIKRADRSISNEK